MRFSPRVKKCRPIDSTYLASYESHLENRIQWAGVQNAITFKGTNHNASKSNSNNKYKIQVRIISPQGGGPSPIFVFKVYRTFYRRAKKVKNREYNFLLKQGSKLWPLNYKATCLFIVFFFVSVGVIWRLRCQKRVKKQKHSQCPPVFDCDVLSTQSLFSDQGEMPFSGERESLPSAREGKYCVFD